MTDCSDSFDIDNAYQSGLSLPYNSEIVQLVRENLQNNVASIQI